MILTFVFYLCHDMVMITLTNDYLAIERDFAGVEGHQDVVDDDGDVVGGEEKHKENLREKTFTHKNGTTSTPTSRVEQGEIEGPPTSNISSAKYANDMPFVC